MSRHAAGVGLLLVLFGCTPKQQEHSVERSGGVVTERGVTVAAGPQVLGPVADAAGKNASRGAETFPLTDVRLLDGPFRDAQQRGLAYLLSLDPDRLLHTFRLNAGLPTHATPLGGWEAPGVELRGHSLGHYLSACALMAEATGDERLKKRALGIVAELRKAQEALAAHGSHAGYVSAFPEEFFDRLEKRQDVWAPYYTLHKIMAGLRDVYRATGDAASLEVLRGMASWVGFRASRLDGKAWQALLETEFGGMQEVLTDLYAITGDPEHLRLARLFDHRAIFDPLAAGEDPLDGVHANTQIPKAIGAARDCALTHEARYCAVAENFWKHVALERSYVIGGNSEYEHFSPIAHLSRHLGVKTAETCNTYNMLKLTLELFERDADPARIDFYERGLFNQILASQDPATGMVTYHLALRPGAWRTYSTPTDSFWCCVGTGMENPARYGDAIYAHQDDAILVNLFVASELTWADKGLVLRQETRFPDEGRTRLVLRLQKPARFALRVRHPAWADTVTVQVQGEPARSDSARESFMSIEREWHDGDVVDVQLPLTLRAEVTRDDPSVVAFLAGPIVLAADLGSAGLDHASRYGMPAPELELEKAPPAPTVVAETVGDALARIRPTATPLVFHGEGQQPGEFELRPFFRLTDRRYAVYLPVLSRAAAAEHDAAAKSSARAHAELDARTVDRVQPGLVADEKRHELAQKATDAGRFEGRLSRGAFWGKGEFSYVLKLPASGPATLRFECWGGESRRHRFEVLADGEVLGTRVLYDDQPGDTLPTVYPLPERLTAGHHSIRIGFRSPPGGSIGAVFDVRILKATGEQADGRAHP